MDHAKFYESGTKFNFDQIENPEEIEIRNAVGRIYYYIYHEVLKWVNSDNTLRPIYLNLDIKSFHLKLRKVFFELVQETNIELYGKISRLLENLHQARCDCDYDLLEVVDKDLYDTFIVNFTDLKQACLKFKNDIFPAFECEILEEIASTNIENAKITILKKGKSDKPKLRIL